MANQVKTSGEHGLALQVTKPARAAGFVDEDAEGEATRLADVRVYAVDRLLIVVDLEEVLMPELTELIVAAAKDTKSIHRAMDAAVQIAGNGYQVQLPPATDAGFAQGDRAPCHTAPGVVAISKDDGTSAGAGAARIAKDITTIRNEQIQRG